MKLSRGLAFTLVGSLSVGSAFLVSLKFLRHSRAQTGAAAAAGTPNAGVPNPGMPNAGSPNPGNPNAGMPSARGPGPASVPPAGANPNAMPGAPGAGAPPPGGQNAANGAATNGQSGGAPNPPTAAAPNPGNPGAPNPGGNPGQLVDPNGGNPNLMPTSANSSATGGITQLEGFLEPFIYDIVNRRDPFLAYAEFIPKAEGVPEDTGPQRALSPAQRWDLDQLRLIGIMWDIKDPKAMFLDPEQDVMILGRDESIGNRNGYVATIREGEVVVVEALRKHGDITYRTKVLRIER